MACWPLRVLLFLLRALSLDFPASGSPSGLGSRDFVRLAGPTYPDSDLMAFMLKKMGELEQQVKSQNEEMVSKVGLQVGKAWGGF